MLINFWDVAGELATKALYVNLTFKEQRNLLKLSEWGNQDFERKFGEKRFMESDF